MELAAWEHLVPRSTVLEVIDLAAGRQLDLIASGPDHEQLVAERVDQAPFLPHRIAAEQCGSSGIRQFRCLVPVEPAIAEADRDFDVVRRLLGSRPDAGAGEGPLALGVARGREPGVSQLLRVVLGPLTADDVARRAGINQQRRATRKKE